MSLSGVVLSITNSASGIDQLTAKFANGSTKTVSLQLGSPYPIGTILPAHTLPVANTGWFVCDGQNGTVDLRNRFVYGWGAEAIGVTGGATSNGTAGAGNHSHSVYVDATSLSASQLPYHTHVPDGGYSGWPDGGSIAHGADGYKYLTTYFAVRYPIEASYTGGGAGHNHGASADAVSDHSHLVTIVPPYIRLYYVQRVS